MKTRVTMAIGLVVMVVTTGPSPAQGLKDCPPPPPGFPKFKVQEIATDFKIGYAVHICDVNGDSKPDIVVVDKERVVWYENPTWKMRPILQGKTKPDNVCICSLDIDKDGRIDFVLGAGWKPFDTKTPGTLQWLRRKASLDEEWEMFPIPCDEPTVHRVQTRRVYSCFGAEDRGFVMSPLMGRDSTKEKNWLDGRPVRILEFDTPKNPTDTNAWKPAISQNDLHVVHNFRLGIRSNEMFEPDYFATYNGIFSEKLGLYNNPKIKLINEAYQQTPSGSRGASEIDVYIGHIATIEPWHGNQIVYYQRGHPNIVDNIANLGNDPVKFQRVVVDDHLRWGHAIKLIPPDNSTDAPLIIAGVRDNPDPKQGDTFTEKRGVRIYRAADAKGEKWERYILEDGGVAVEDLAVADLNGDGKPEIIAVGRATQNCRIYWNQGK